MVVTTCRRYSMAVDGSVNDLLALVKATLSADEIALISTPDTRNNEPDAYTALQNHFTQKNTDAMIKCAHTATPRISQSQWPTLLRFFGVILTDLVWSCTLTDRSYFLCRVFY